MEKINFNKIKEELNKIFTKEKQKKLTKILSVITPPAVGIALNPQLLTSAAIVAAGAAPVLKELLHEGGIKLVEHGVLTEIYERIRSRFKGKSDEEIHCNPISSINDSNLGAVWM